LARSCAVGELRSVLKIRKSRWFGYVKRGDEDGVLIRVVNVEVAGQRLPERLKKSWRRCVDEDLATLEVDEEDALYRARWRRLIKRLTP
jgi:hypothetical protein